MARDNDIDVKVQWVCWGNKYTTQNFAFAYHIRLVRKFFIICYRSVSRGEEVDNNGNANNNGIK